MNAPSTEVAGKERRLRVLLSCYYFSPYHGGEAAVGWNFAIHLSKQFDVTVLCGDLGESTPTLDAWRRYEQSSPAIPGLRVVHVPPSRLTRWIHRAHALPGFWMLYYPAYRLWQKSAYLLAKSLHAEEPFDLAHQLTIITCREPGYLHRLGIPWFWGPINGAVLMPWRFLWALGFRGFCRHLSRNLLNLLQTRLARRPALAAKVAADVWAVTREDQELVNRFWKGSARLMLETGTTIHSDRKGKSRHHGEPLKLVWCGIIEARKALPLLIHALARLPASISWELAVIGNGPEESRCQRLAETLGIGGRIIWMGRVSHDVARERISDGHVLVHSAVKEGTPHVVLEALAAGVPVVCHDTCGMGVAIESDCGIKIPVKSPQASIEGFCAAITRLADEPNLLESLSTGALRRASSLSWDAKIEEIAATYHKHFEGKI